MTKQYRAELKALRKQKRTLATERKTINRNCAKAQKRIIRELNKIIETADAFAVKASEEVTRDQNRESKRLDKTEKDIAARIAVLEGRL